jgi:hypothetical protein
MTHPGLRREDPDKHDSETDDRIAGIRRPATTVHRCSQAGTKSLAAHIIIRRHEVHVRPDPKDVEHTYDEETRRALANVYSLLLELAREKKEDKRSAEGEAEEDSSALPEGSRDS